MLLPEPAPLVPRAELRRPAPPPRLLRGAPATSRARGALHGGQARLLAQLLPTSQSEVARRPSLLHPQGARLRRQRSGEGCYLDRRARSIPPQSQGGAANLYTLSHTRSTIQRQSTEAYGGTGQNCMRLACALFIKNGYQGKLQVPVTSSHGACQGVVQHTGLLRVMLTRNLSESAVHGLQFRVSQYYHQSVLPRLISIQLRLVALLILLPLCL